MYAYKITILTSQKRQARGRLLTKIIYRLFPLQSTCLGGCPLIPPTDVGKRNHFEVLRTMKEKKNKSVMIGLRLTNEEFAKFEPVIQATGLGKSEFFRLIILGNFDPGVNNNVKKNNQRELLRLFNKSSNNLNQIAKKINTEYRNGFISESTYLRYLNILINIRDAFVRGVDKC